MNAQPPDRTGLLVVRLWTESNARDGFRARVTHTLDSSGRNRTVSMAGTAAALFAVVQNWVDEFISN